MVRCEWCGEDSLYMKYHDEEWGVPVHDDKKHFEFLMLESAQAGLSWITILRKRENYRAAYDGFNPQTVAAYGEDKIAELMGNAGIVRNRLKIQASIQNARLFLEIQKEFGSFDRYIWSFVDGSPIMGYYDNISQIPTTTPLSDKVSADLKKRGFKFVGSTIVYSHLQATGVVNDHINTCFRRI